MKQKSSFSPLISIQKKYFVNQSGKNELLFLYLIYLKYY